MYKRQKVTGEAENVSKAVRAIGGLLTLINRGEALSEQNVRYVLSLVEEGSEDKIHALTADCICITSRGKPVKPKTLGQKRYIEAVSYTHLQLKSESRLIFVNKVIKRYCELKMKKIRPEISEYRYATSRSSRLRFLDS